MHYCKNFFDGENNQYKLPFIDKVDFSYTKSDKEYYEPIKIYLNQIKVLKGQYSPGYLERSEELALFERVEKGDEVAKELVFNKFLTYVIRIVRHYVGNGVAIEDLIQEGNLALLKAIKTFDYRKGYRFSTYAKLMIRRKLWLCIPFYLTPFDIPVNSVSTMRNINKRFEEISMENYEECSILRNSRFYSKNELELYYTMNSFSINDMEYGELESIQDIFEISFEDQVITKRLIIGIAYIMSNYLTDREENVIRLLYGLDDGRERTYEEVGKVFGVTRERIRQIKLKAIKKY